jgi:hypothetical protein
VCVIGTRADSAGTGGTSGTGGSSGALGGSSSGENGGADGPGACSHTAPPGHQITDFSTWTADGWGDATTLSGGAYTYDNGDQLRYLTYAVTDQTLSLTGTVPAGGYAGFGLWFSACIDASAYDGISFGIGGDSGGARASFQVHTSRNYPIDTVNNRGECEGVWGAGCSANRAPIVISESEPVSVRTAELVGGEPIDPLDPTELLGVQWEFLCGLAQACEINVTLDDITFTRL